MIDRFINFRTTLWLAVTAGIVWFGCSDDSPTESDNLAPVMMAQGDTIIVSGDTIQLIASASDPEGDSLTYRLIVFVSQSEWKAGDVPDTDMSASTGVFTFRALDRDVPSRDFAFGAVDVNGGEASPAEFAVVVNPAPPDSSMDSLSVRVIRVE